MNPKLGELWNNRRSGKGCYSGVIIGLGFSYEMRVLIKVVRTRDCCRRMGSVLNISLDTFGDRWSRSCFVKEGLGARA